MLKRQCTFRKLVNDSHLHDLGKLLFAFSTFWMYIWYSQFMLIWYGNLPEEAMYYAGRMRGMWGILFFSVVVLEWVVPFFVLMSRKAKRSEAILLKVSIVVLAGHWLDLYVGVMYPVDGQNPVPGIWEVSVALAAVLASAGFILYSFRQVPPVPSGDPLLPESLQHHT